MSDVASQFAITPFTDIEELKMQIVKYREEVGFPEFDFKNVGAQLDLEYRDLAAYLQLPFFVTVQHCARDVYRVILSERPLTEELKHHKLDQRTFVWAGTNKKGKTCDTILVTHDKYYTDVPMRPEVLGIKKRELRVVEIHYLAVSDRFIGEIIKDIRTKCKLNTPAERDLDMNSRLLDARVCEKVLAVNKLVISENDNIKKDAEWQVKTNERRMYRKLQVFLEDAQSTGKAEKGSRFGISIFPGSLKDVIKLIVIFIGIYFIVGLIFSFFGVVLPGIGGGPSTPVGPQEPEPYNPENPAAIVPSLFWLIMGAL